MISLESLSEMFFFQLMNDKNTVTQSESIELEKAADKRVLRINR